MNSFEVRQGGIRGGILRHCQSAPAGRPFTATPEPPRQM